VLVVVGEVVGHAGGPRVQRPAAELLSGDDLAGRGLHQRRPAEEDGALVLDDDGLVRHRGDVRAAGRAAAEHGGDLSDALGAHGGLVEEDPAEVLAVGEDLVLGREVRAAGVDEVDARQPVVQRHLLGAQVLLDGHRVVGAALDGRVVATTTHSRPDTRPMPVIMPRRAPRRRTCRRRPAATARGTGCRVEQRVDAVPGQQLAAADVALAAGRRPALPDGLEPGPQLVRQRPVHRGVVPEGVAAGVQ
jgi:hypothetical protein